MNVKSWNTSTPEASEDLVEPWDHFRPKYKDHINNNSIFYFTAVKATIKRKTQSRTNAKLNKYNNG